MKYNTYWTCLNRALVFYSEPKILSMTKFYLPYYFNIEETKPRDHKKFRLRTFLQLMQPGFDMIVNSVTKTDPIRYWLVGRSAVLIFF